MSKSELLLLSSILRTRDAVTPKLKGISPELFHAHKAEAKWLWDYMGKYGKAPSKAAYRNHFPDARLLKADDVELYCEEVMQSHAKHNMLVAMEEATDSIANGDPFEALKHLQSASIRTALEVSLLGESSCVLDDWQAIYEEAKRRVDTAAERGLPGLSTGFSTLDDRSGGYQPGHFWVWAARLGEGKTWTLIRSACAALYDGATVNYHTLEQSRSQIALRVHTFLSAKYGEETFRNMDLMRGKNYSLKEYKRFLRKLKSDVPGRLHVMDTQRGRVSAATIAAGIEQHQPQIVFIDYITLMEQGGDDWRATAKLAGDIKILATQYGIPIVVAAQLNRSAAIGKEPAGPEALSQSDAIGMDADGLVTMKRYSDSVRKLKLAKYRHGPDGYMWWAKFLPNTGFYEECSYDEAMELQEADRERADEEATR